MDKQLKKKILSVNKWTRLLFIFLFILIEYIVSWLIIIASLFQFLVDLMLDKPNNRLEEFTRHLNTYLLQIANFLTYNTDIKPFPFAPWPGEKK